MQFLKTIFWVVIAVFLVIVSRENWHDVTLNLWGNLQADIKLPVLILIVALAGFLPPYLIGRSRLWSLRRQLAFAERQRAEPEPAPVQAETQPAFGDDR